MKVFHWLFCSLLLTGLALGQHKAVSPPKRPTTLNLWVSKNVAPSSKIRIVLDSQNVPVVSVAAYHVDAIGWLQAHSDANGARGVRPAAVGKPVKTWQVGIATKDNPPNPHQLDRYYSRQVNLPLLDPGVYLLQATGGGAQSWAVVNVTNLSVITKESPKHLLVWVTDAVKGQPIPDCRVLVLDDHNKSHLLDARTRADGTYFGALPPGDHWVIVNRGKDYAAIGATAENPNGQLVAHFQTDRPIYRPGQTVSFKAILRRTQDIAYSTVANADVDIELRDPKNNEIDQAKLKSNQLGSVAGQFEIPEEGQSGEYSLVLHQDGQSAYFSFAVAMYRKPEYKVDITPLQNRYLAGETLRFKVSAQYYFGAPVLQAEVRYTVRRVPNDYYWDSGSEDSYFYGGDGNLYAHDTYSQQPFVAEDVVHTDGNGEAVIEIKSDPKAEDSTYAISCTVTDSSRRQVDGSASVPVYSASIRLGLSTNVVFVPLGKLVPLTVSAVNLDGKPVAASVTLIVTHQVWNEKKKEFETVELARTQVKVPPSGHAAATIPAKAEGDITIDAEAGDGTGRTAHASLSTYVVGPEGKIERVTQGPTIQTMLNKRGYNPGDTASGHVLVNTKGWPILMVVEGQDIYNYKVVSGSSSWDFSTNKSMSPNAFFTAAQWVKSQLYSSNSVIPLPDKTRLLHVTLKTDKQEYKPGDTATLGVTAHKADGSPAETEVAINVVDAAIYALSPDNTPDLYKLFWGRRGNLVQTRQAAPEELSGGAYQNVSTVAPLRQRFEDTAFWQPFAETGPDGTGSVSFEMPGNLTTWDAAARAIDSNTSVDTASTSVVATRPVTLRLSTPRQMVQGDKLTIIGTVDNRTASAHSFTVEMKPEGLKLESATSQQLSVPAHGEGTLTWTLLADHIGSQPPALTAQVVCQDVSEADRADYSDALRMTFPVRPDGVAQRILTGSVVSGQANAVLKLPSDKIEPASVVKLRIWSGIKPLVDDSTSQMLKEYRYGTMVAVDQLEAAASAGLDNSNKAVREALALLSRDQQPEGWGYWTTCRPTPVVTAEVVRAFGLVQDKINVPDGMRAAGISAARTAYGRTNLWEYRALLAGAIALSSPDVAKALLDETAKRGQNMSPYAQLRLAEGYLALQDKATASQLVESVIPAVSEGPTSAYLPVGDGVGWNANSMQTTAELLNLIVRLGIHADLQPKLANWLVAPTTDEWPSLEDQTERILGLQAYLTVHPPAESTGEAQVSVGGQTLKMDHAKVGDMLTASIPETLLTAGDNTIRIERTGQGEAFYEVDAVVFRALRHESEEGIRVARRYEVKNAAGIWTELHRPVEAGETVRSTLLVWGDNVPDVLRINDPLPSGFEFVDEDSAVDSETDVRDGAIVHYVLTQGTPLFLVSYIRAESEGDLAVLPASAEVLRRPENRGQSDESHLTVVAKAQ